jgi:AcrR family transcriptional regulator
MERVAENADTRGRLVSAAAHLFARRGIETVPLRDIGTLAGQRNASAVQYHFGGRWELVTAILARHARTVAGWDDPGVAAFDEEVVRRLVELLRPELATAGGRDFLRVVFELVARYPGRWDRDPQPHVGMANLVERLADRADGLPRRLARARAVALTQFVCYQMAERARLVDDEVADLLDEDTFAGELVAMATALLRAPRPEETP